MKRLLVVLFVVVLITGCGMQKEKEDSTEQNASAPNVTAADLEMGEEEADMSDEEKKVLEAFQRFQQAMIDKDTETLTALVVPDITFTHMSGKTQTKEEFFGEIEDGTLNYYKYELHDPVITIDGDTATLTGSTTLTAKVYGMSGSWTLPTNAHYIKINGEWIHCN